MTPASDASAGIAACTTLLRATSACRVIAPITRLSPSRATPASSRTFLRSTSAAGDARRCFMVGSRVMPPASALASGFARSATAAESDVGAMIFKGVHCRILPMRGQKAAERRPLVHSAARFITVFCAARQTTCGVAGMATSSWPSASVMRVDDRRRRGDRARFAAALDAERIGRTERLDRLDLERRQVVGARHAIVHEARRQQLAVAVVMRAFEQRLADALGDAAMHLAFDDHRIDELAEVVDRGPASIVTTPVSGSISTSQMWTPAGKVKLVGSQNAPSFRPGSSSWPLNLCAI